MTSWARSIGIIFVLARPYSEVRRLEIRFARKMQLRTLDGCALVRPCRTLFWLRRRIFDRRWTMLIPSRSWLLPDGPGRPGQNRLNVLQSQIYISRMASDRTTDTALLVVVQEASSRPKRRTGIIDPFETSWSTMAVDVEHLFALANISMLPTGSNGHI